MGLNKGIFISIKIHPIQTASEFNNLIKVFVCCFYCLFITNKFQIWKSVMCLLEMKFLNIFAQMMVAWYWLWGF